MHGVTALRPSSRWTAVPLALLAVLAVGLWVIWPRFSITGPSLIDDWTALVSAPATVHALVHFDYEIGQRFRPTWELWNWLQWRVPGAPGDMLGPNLLDVARLALLIGGLTAFALLVVPRRRMNRFEHAFLCALPALVVVTVPAFGQDLARFGPEEPALVGGMTLGGSLMYWGGSELALVGRSRVRAWALFAIGFVAWCYGVFQKETSVCVLLALGLAIPYGQALRRRLTRREATVGLILIAVALLPVLGMLYEVLRIVQRGSLVYSTHVKTTGGSLSVLGDGLRFLYSSTQSVAGYVLLAVIGVAVSADIWRRRVDWLQLAIVVIGLATLEMTSQTEIFESRYYIPMIALLAVGAARAVGQLPVVGLRAAIVIVFGLALVSGASGRSTVRYWAVGDQAGDDLVASVREHTHNGCNLTISGVDLERTQSIETLVRYPDGPSNCAGVGRYVVTGPAAQPPQHCGTPLGEWDIAHSEVIRLGRC